MQGDKEPYPLEKLEGYLKTEAVELNREYMDLFSKLQQLRIRARRMNHTAQAVVGAETQKEVSDWLNTVIEGDSNESLAQALQKLRDNVIQPAYDEGKYNGRVVRGAVCGLLEALGHDTLSQQIMEW